MFDPLPLPWEPSPEAEPPLPAGSSHREGLSVKWLRKKGSMGEFSHPGLAPELLQRKCFLKHILHRCSFCFTVSQTLHTSKVSQFGLVKFLFKRQQNMAGQNPPNTRVSSADDFPCSSVLLSSCDP